MLRKLSVVLGFVAILGGGAILLVVLQQMRPKPEERITDTPPPSVFIIEARPQTTTVDVVTQGEVQPRTDINLTAQVQGRVESLSQKFVNGGQFSAGDVLLRIEDTDYRLALTRAEARVAQAEQVLRQEQAEAQLAARDWEELGDGSPPSDLTLRKPQLAQAQANYEAAKADEREARLNLDRTIIRAPFDGRVRSRAVGQGQFVAPGAQLGRVFSTDVAEIRLPLTDADLATLRLPLAFTASEDDPGPEVLLEAVVGASQNQWLGHIRRTEGAIDPATRQIGAIVVVEDPYGSGSDNGVPLAIGLFVNATIRGRPIDNAFVIPTTALYGRDLVYIVDDKNILERRTVQTASVDSEKVIVVSGLKKGDRIVVSPLRGNDAGNEVTPVLDEDMAARLGLAEADLADAGSEG